MKNALLVIVILAALFGLAAYFHPGFSAWLQSLTGDTTETTIVYKWKDEKGVWHVTSEPPPPGVEYQEQEYLRDANVLPVPGQENSDSD